MVYPSISGESPLPLLVEQVRHGERLGAYVQLSQSAGDLETCQALGLQAVAAPVAGQEHGDLEHAIAYLQPAAELLVRQRLAPGAFLGKRRSAIRKLLTGSSVADGLAKLQAYPREDTEYEGVGWPGRARPEVAWAQGALLGYPPCCTTYYLQTRYLREPRHGQELLVDHPRLQNRICCPECALQHAEAEQARQLWRAGLV